MIDTVWVLGMRETGWPGLSWLISLVLVTLIKLTVLVLPGSSIKTLAWWE